MIFKAGFPPFVCIIADRGGEHFDQLFVCAVIAGASGFLDKSGAEVVVIIIADCSKDNETIDCGCTGSQMGSSDREIAYGAVLVGIDDSVGIIII
jgi:hypothetical protein